jgi:hypothetical protein
MLTDKQIKAAQPKKGSYYITDNTDRRGYGRLAIKISPSGNKAFYLAYRFNDSRKFLPLGKYPTLPLKEARKLADEYGQLVFDGKDPRAAIENRKRLTKEKNEEDRKKALEGNIVSVYSPHLDKHPQLL